MRPISAVRAGGDRERGAALLEFAVVVPFFLLLVFGLVEVSRFVATQVSVQAAAAGAARFGSGMAPADGAVVPRSVDCDGIVAAAIHGAPFADLTAADVYVAWDTGPGTEAMFDCTDSASPPAPSVGSVTGTHRVTVSVFIDYTGVVPMIGHMFDQQLSGWSARSIMAGEFDA